MNKDVVVYAGKIKKEVFISWNVPPGGWMKLNTNGSSKGNLGQAGYSGIVYDESKTWIGAYSYA